MSKGLLYGVEKTLLPTVKYTYAYWLKVKMFKGAGLFPLNILSSVL